MGLVILGAGIMLVGVLVGYGIRADLEASTSLYFPTEEVAKWIQAIDEINEDK